MSSKLLYLLVTISLFHISKQNVNDNEIEVEDVNPFAEAASSLFKENNAENIGGMIGQFMQSGDGKQLGDMLMSGLSNNNGAASQILQSLGSMMNQKGGSGGGGGLDPAMIGNLLGMLNNNQNDKNSGFDFSSLLGGLMNQDGNVENMLNYAPMLMSTFNSFFGPEAQARADSHSGHAWFLPPILEKIHVLIDHFLHSDLGRSLVNKIGGEKFINIFKDENGKFSYQRFVDLLENHSFRRHWIHMITSRLADVLSYFADPYTQKRFTTTAQFFINNFLKSQGFPKSALYDPSRPTESINSFINHISKKMFNTKVNAKMYIKPIVEYIQEVFKLAEKKGILGRAIDSSALSHKLTDTINLEIIEPIARVNRAYRFAKKIPKCDRYVMCLVNQENPDDQISLPGLKPLLSKSSSLFASWFLSGYTGTSFWTLYSVIMDENNCQARYLEACNDFHIEEIKVTTEFMHNEL